MSDSFTISRSYRHEHCIFTSYGLIINWNITVSNEQERSAKISPS